MIKTGGSKLALFLVTCLVQGVLWTLILVPNQVKAVDPIEISSCGTTISLSGTYSLTTDLNCNEAVAISIEANSVVLDGNDHAITGQGDGDKGISIADGLDDVTVQNFMINNFEQNISFTNLTNSHILSNNLSNGAYDGIFGGTMDSFLTSDVEIANNTISQNSYGLRLQANGNGDEFTNFYIHDNTFTHNASAILYYGIGYNFDDNDFLYNSRVYENFDTAYDPLVSDTNTFTNNTYKHNLGRNHVISFDTALPTTVDIGDTVTIDLTLRNPAGAACSGCVADVGVYPSETWTTPLTNSNNSALGSFAISQSGTYSVVITVTDANNNTTKRIYKILSGNTDTSQVTYYLRGTNPTRGQPISILPGADAKTMTLQEPTILEEWYCGQWIQNSPDDLPNYPFSNINNINVSSWYQSDDAAGFTEKIVAQRYVQRGVDVFSDDKWVQVAAPTTNFDWLPDKRIENVDWNMDYNWSWYWLSLKLIGKQFDNDNKLSWITFPESDTSGNKSNAVFTYSYATTPTIKSSSNELVNILAATSPANDPNNATLILDTTDLLETDSHSTNITLENIHRSFSGFETSFSSDGSATVAANNISGQVTLTSVPLNIVPDAGTVSVTIDTWRTDGDFYKKWTENGSGVSSASHTIGNLAPNTYYSVKADGSIYGEYLSDSSGEITFSYNGGYSIKTFEVGVRAPTGNTLPDTGASIGKFFALLLLGQIFLSEAILRRRIS